LCQDYLLASKRNDSAKLTSFFLEDGLSKENLELNQKEVEAGISATAGSIFQTPADAKISEIEKRYILPFLEKPRLLRAKPVRYSTKPMWLLSVRLKSADDEKDSGMHRGFELPVVENGGAGGLCRSFICRHIWLRPASNSRNSHMMWN
jgi:hypothetical protein